MNKKLLTLLFVPSLLTTSCGFFSSNSEGGEGGDKKDEINFSITHAEFTDDNGHLTVNYTCNLGNPFTLEDYPFSKLNNFGVVVSELDYSQQGVFTLKTPVVTSSLKLEFFTTSNEVYITSRYEGVVMYEPDIPPEVINFAITHAEYTSEDGDMLVNYTCDKGSPFSLTNHPFSKLTNYNSQVQILDSSTYGTFTLKTSTISTSLKFDFYDTDNNVYISYTYEGIEQYVPSSSIVYPTGYTTLYWSDEFDGNQLNQSNWTYEIGNGYSGWGNNESQYYTNSNEKVQDGKLIISAKKQSISGFNYTSTRIKTQNKVHFTYGYIEASIALPSVTGMWPAFWMMPDASIYGGWPHSGEIDIMEAKGRLSYQSSSALHFSTSGGDHTYLAHEQNGHNITQFHKYAVEWQKDYIKYFIDDVCHLEINKDQWTTVNAKGSATAPFDKDFYIILNLAVGGHFDNYQMPPENFVSADMVVDYVRVFK